MSNFIKFEQSRFLKGQLLTDSDLNALWDFLEPQDRYTRISLIGAGVFYGLKLFPYDSKDMKIIVTKGAGVSSEGHLFFLEQDQPFHLEKHYADSSGSGGQDERFNLQILNPTIAEEKVDAWEFSALLPNQSPQNPPTDFSQYCFVLYFKSDTIAGDASCFSSFNPKGLRTTYNLKLLALPEAAIEKIWLTKATGDGGSNPTAPQFPYVERLPVWNLIKDKQPVPGTNGIKQNVTWEELCKEYEDLCKAAIGSDNNGTVTAFIKIVLKDDFDTALKNLIASFVGDKKLQLQYLHDYLKDLVAAHEEWAVTRPEVRAEVWFPNTAEFPKFVALGKSLSPDGAAANIGCRMPRYYPGIPGDLNLPQTEPLFERLKFMAAVANLDFFSLTSPNAIVKITGSRRKCPPLSEQAIPFYYKNNSTLRELWNPAMTAAGRTMAIPSYFPHPSPTTKPFDQPLYYDLEQFDFYRVEGHIGKSLGEGFTAVCNLRNELNLPFDIVLLRVGPTINYNNLTDDPKVEEAISEMNFTQFASKHPGMEHMGGVPRGGTLILVFKEDDAFKTGVITEKTDPSGIKIYIVTRPDLPRTIVADFCLPYSCFKGPNIDYIIKETSEAGELVADFDKVSEDFFAKKDIQGVLHPMVTMRLEDRSINAEEYEWTIEKLQGSGSLQTKPLPNKPLIIEENLAEIQKVKVTLTAKRSGAFAATKSVSKEISLCPTDLSFLVEDPSAWKSWKEEITIEAANEAIELNLQFSLPGGGRFLYLDTKNGFNSLAKIENETNETAQLSLSPDIKPGTYTVRLATPCAGLERQVRITITLPGRPDDEFIAARSTAADTRREQYLANIKEVADKKLEATAAHKRTIAFLTLPHLAVEDAVMEFEGIARLLFNNIGKSGGATDEQYLALLHNATWGLLDKVVAINPAAMPDTLQTALENLVPALQKVNVDVDTLRDDWKGQDLKTDANAELINAIEAILKT